MARDGSETASGSAFRPDINGLRALAVVAVTLYHFSPALAPGGYLGVDIFYVISGFLMTRIILGALDGGGLSIWRFYAARARRIAPALLVMCFAVCLIAALVLDPWTAESVARDALASVTFSSNLLYATQGGYFAEAHSSNWLLHTWSLSVEWQFYLLYPLGLLLLRRMAPSQRAGLIALGGVTLASFALALLAAKINGTSAAWGFYLLPTRAWEMCVGGLCAYAGPLPMSDSRRRLVHALGVLVLVASCAVIYSRLAPQPAWILVPALGTAAVIAADIREPLWARLGVVRRLGLWSYSIYLWHWPIVAALYYTHTPLTPFVVALGVAGSVALGAFSHALVERRLTDRIFAWRPASTWRAMAAGLVVVAGLAAATATSRGFEALRSAPLSPASRAIMQDARAAAGDWAWPAVCPAHRVIADGVDGCVFGDPEARDLLVIGDSHVQQLGARFVGTYGSGEGVTVITKAGCFPVPGVGLQVAGANCRRWADGVYAFAERAGFRRIVIGSIWFGYLEPEAGERVGNLCFAQGAGCAYPTDPVRYRVSVERAMGRFGDELGRLRAAGADVTVIGPFPAFDEADAALHYRAGFRGDERQALSGDLAILDRRAGYMRGLLKQATARGGASLIEPVDALCPGGLCPLVVDGRINFKDKAHYRASVVATDAFDFLDPVLRP